MTYPAGRRFGHPERAAPDSVPDPAEPIRARRAAPEPIPPPWWAEDPEAFIETRILDRRELLAALAPQRFETPRPEAEPVDSDEEDHSSSDLNSEIDQADRRNLGRNSLLMASGTLVSRVLGMINGTLQAAVLGSRVVGDAFSAANTLPNFILVLLSGGILNAVLIPQITKAMKSPDGSREFVDRLVTLALAMTGLVAVICTAGAALLIRAITSLRGPALELAVAFGYLCMPQVLFYGVFALLGNILNARGSFGAFGWAPVANNVIAISGELTFLALWGTQEDPSAWTPAMILVLAGTATLGIIVQAVILIPALIRTGFRWRPRWGLRGYGFGQLGRFAALTFTALVIAQAGGMLVVRVATYLVDRPHGPNEYIPGYFAYQRALALFQMPHSLIAVSLLTALFPQLARAWQRREDPKVGLRDMQELLYRGLTLPMVGIIPASALLVALAVPLTRVVYFSMAPQEAQGVAMLLVAMVASMTAFTVVTLQQQYCFATEQGWTNLWMQCLLTGVQVGFALLALVAPPRLGMVVVCLGMFVGNGLVAVVFVLYARRQIGPFGLRSVVWLYFRLGVAAALAGTVAMVTSVSLSTRATGSMASVIAAPLTHQLLGGAVGGVGFLVVFVALAKLLRIKEFFGFLAPIRRRLNRRAAARA